MNQSPSCELEPIGGEHGVSCVFPRLSDIIDFEKGTLRINRGYPRFVNHPYLSGWLKKKFPGEAFVILFCSVEAAKFVRDHFSEIGNAEVRGTDDFGALIVQNNDDYKKLFEDCRNTGFTLSSRKVKRMTEGKQASCGEAVLNEVKSVLCRHEPGSTSRNIFLFPSGMAAVYTAVLSLFSDDKRHAVIMGNPYVDTRLIFEKMAMRKGYPLPSFIEVDEDPETHIRSDTALIFVEFPTNPLIRVADLGKIAAISRKHRIPVIIDSTIASSHNVNPFEFGFEIIMQSTTKFFNGMNDHLGGVLFLHPDISADIRGKIRELQRKTRSEMDPEEAEVLLSHLPGFTARMEKINRNALEVARFLEKHENIRKVYYPSLASHPDHILAMEYLKKGASGLLSFEIRNSSLETAGAFYDHCTLPGKGPSLGSEQTLLCPITLLSFFSASDDQLKSMGLDRYLMRISVGTEDPSVIIRHLENGLSKV